ncbi:MAG: Nif3-like dinuclear metal center hexameric protein [Arcobacteraceae bacterium]|nr:Nif3-like dinuclear metal center hexameric protein [Arcobacteraceae bacterium]
MQLIFVQLFLSLSLILIVTQLNFFKYHDATEAQSRNIGLIDIGHYESEQHFSPLVMGLIEKYLLKNEIKAIITASQNPFDYK